jgi:hypothetical protein
LGKTTNWQKITEKILSLHKKMRFVAIIDLKGNIVEGIMKEGKASLESQCNLLTKMLLLLLRFQGSFPLFHNAFDNVSFQIYYGNKSHLFMQG